MKIKIPKKSFNELLSHYKDMGYVKEEALLELKELIKFIDDLPEELKLYRIVHLDEENVLDTKRLGSHYSYDKNNLLDSHYRRGWISKGNFYEGQTVLVEVKVDKSQIDIMETLSNNILYPNEKEITLKNKGRGVTIININEL